MRLKRSRLNKYWHKAAIQKKDGEGNTYIEYGSAVSFMAEMWTGGGEVQEKMYGIRLPNIRNLRIDGKYQEIPGTPGKIRYRLSCGAEITVNDGICIYSGQEEKPDYKVVAIYPYRFLTLEVEKL